MDKKIRTAAENSIHSYDDNSWKDMEVLLNKHLPEQRRRRWIIYFVLSAAVAISGFLLIRELAFKKQPIVEDKTNSVIKNASEQNQRDNTTTNQLPAANTNGNSEKNSVSQDKNVVAPTEQTNNPVVTETTNSNTVATEQTPSKANKMIIPVPTNSNRKGTQPAYQRSFVSNNRSATAGVLKPANKKITAPASVETPDKADNSNTNNPKPVTSPGDNQTGITGSTTEKTSLPINITPEAATTKNEEKKPATTVDSSTVAKNNPVKKQLPKKKGDKLSLSFSLGPDISAVGTDPGRFKVGYGFGIGYAITDRWSVRTGFYGARKIYSADSNNYHKPLWFPYNSKLEYIKANCYVYEIPLTVVYNFGETKHHSWFASAGLSSFVMKEEKYEYHLKNSWGQRSTDLYNYRYENYHLFSVVDLSGGYQYNVSKRFSILAEPYLKLPVAGVGVGKVKLNSAGILFTASLKPFKK